VSSASSVAASTTNTSVGGPGPPVASDGSAYGHEVVRERVGPGAAGPIGSGRRLSRRCAEGVWTCSSVEGRAPAVSDAEWRRSPVQ
jgi:hypothetical protein